MKSSSHIGKTLKHALIYSGATIISKVLGFFMLPVYAHYLHAEGYGILGMVDVVISVATMVIGYGITGAMWRFYFQKETEEERNTLVSSTIILMFFLVVVVSIPLLLLHDQLGYLAFGRRDLGYFIVIATLAFICEMTAKSAEAYILIRQKPLIYSSLSFLRLFLGFPLNIYFIVYLKMGVLGFLYTSLICSFVITVITHTYALNCVGIRFSREIAKEILGFSLPLLPGYLAMFIRGNADRVIMRTFMGLSQLGAYEMINKFVYLLGILIVEPFSKSWDVKRFQLCETAEGPEMMARMFTFLLALLLFVGMVLALEIPLVLRILTPKEFWQGEVIACLLVLSRILNAVYYQLNFGLNYAKMTGKVSKIQITCSVLDMALNLILIPIFGILGAAAASCVVQVTQCSMSYFMAKDYYPIPFQWKKILQMTLICAILIVSIGQLSVEKTGIADRLNQGMASSVVYLLKVMHLDAIKNGKLLQYAVNNISNIVEALIKLTLSLLFLPALMFLNILPRRIISWKVVRHPLRAFSEL